MGRYLSSVTFVQDYIQFCFDGPCLTAITLPVLRKATGVIMPQDQGWRDGLCSEIGVQVAAVRATEDELNIEFVSSSAIAVSLRDKDYVGPEAINYFANDGTIVVG